MAKTIQAKEFVPRSKDDDLHFAGSLYVRNGKAYNVELPNGDAVTLCYVTGKDGPSLQVISSAWCEKTALDVRSDADGDKRFKPSGVYKPAKLSKKSKRALVALAARAYENVQRHRR